MGLIIPLAYDYDGDALDQSLRAAPHHRRLREAVPDVIAAIHGLPAAMDAELSQLDVYVGRSGATVPLLRNRWSARFEAFARAPSAVAVVAVRASTELIQKERWERTAHLLINALQRNGALCCSNAIVGDSGRWPDCDDSVIYVVARLRKGPAGNGVQHAALSAAVMELLNDDELDAHVVRAASREILARDRGTAHDTYGSDDEMSHDESEGYEEDVVLCKREGCMSKARVGNYGFCGRHRAYTPPGIPACKDCGRPALRGNYGFCGLHRR